MTDSPVSAQPASGASGPDPRPARSALRRSRGRWRIFAFLALAVAVVAVAGRFALDRSGGQTDRIARVRIDGVIATDPARLKVLTDLAGNDRVKAVLVEINSPGGTTAGGEELYEALSAIRAKKPVVATIAELGASAAYMTAIASDRIFARRLSIVGSLGVLFQHVDAKKLLDTVGVNLDKVQTGLLKAEPDINDAMTGQVRQSLQTLVDDSFTWFKKIVADRRHLDPAQIAALADGRIVTGQMGLKDGLVDQFGGEPEAIAWLEKDKKIARDLPVVTYYPLPPRGIEAIFQNAGAAAGAGVLKALGLSSDKALVPGNALDGLVSLWHLG